MSWTAVSFGTTTTEGGRFLQFGLEIRRGDERQYIECAKVELGHQDPDALTAQCKAELLERLDRINRDAREGRAE